MNKIIAGLVLLASMATSALALDEGCKMFALDYNIMAILRVREVNVGDALTMVNKGPTCVGKAANPVKCAVLRRVVRDVYTPEWDGMTPDEVGATMYARCMALK